MTTASFVADVLAFSAQIACVIAVAAVVALAIRIDTAAVRYQYWRAVLMLCLLLPWFQSRQPSTAATDAIATVAFSPTTIAAVLPVASAPHGAAGIPWLQIALSIVVAGIVLRFAVIAVGLLQLRRLRRAGYIAPPNPEHDELQWALGTHAEIRYVPDGQPVTCGALRPVVLLPRSLLVHPLEIQRAVLVHELLHVQRRDWTWVMGEEVVRAVLWFHPGIWWLVARVRLAREEVVDELTVLATGQRRAYLEALLAFADAAPFVPSAAFARRKHLFHRMMLISKEAVMSSKRVVVSCVVLALAVFAGSWYAVGAFPMTQAPGVVRPAVQTPTGSEPGPLERRAKPITPENPIPRRTYSVMPQNPAGADAGVVMVTLRVTLDGLGHVGEVRSVGGGAGGRATFFLPSPGADGRGAITRQGGAGPVPPSEDFVKSATAAVRQWLYDPPADPPISFAVSFAFAPGKEAVLLQHGDSGPILSGARGGDVAGGVVGGVVTPPPPPPPPPPGWAQGAIRVGGQIKQPTKTKHVNPEYPPIAQSARVQGVVILETVIAPDGKVQDARVLRSIPLLDQAAVDAVKQWEFTPTMLNGQPVPVIMTMTVQFTLSN